MVGVESGKREGIVTPAGGMQAQANSSMMAEPVPTPAIPGYLRPEGGQSAFAITHAARTPGFVPLRENAAEPLKVVACQASATQLIHRTAVVPPGIYDYAKYYGVTGESVYYVEGFGTTFVHQ